MTPKDKGSAKKYSGIESKQNIPLFVSSKSKNKEEKPNFQKLL